MNTSVANQEHRPQNRGNGARNYITPEVNVFETRDGYVVEAEMPGVNKEGVEVTLEDGELTIIGHRAASETKLETVYRESSDADYRRVFELDATVDTARVDARVEQGVLRVHLPKSERVKPRKVVVSD